MFCDLDNATLFIRRQQQQQSARMFSSSLLSFLSFAEGNKQRFSSLCCGTADARCFFFFCTRLGNELQLHLRRQRQHSAINWIFFFHSPMASHHPHPSVVNLFSAKILYALWPSLKGGSRGARKNEKGIAEDIKINSLI